MVESKICLRFSKFTLCLQVAQARNYLSRQPPLTNHLQNNPMTHTCSPYHITPFPIIASPRVLISGKPGDRIWHARGLRQGDPLSALLFLLIMGVLNAMVDKAEAAGFFEPLDRWGVRHRLSLYANDAVIFLKPESELIAIKEFLALFGGTSGLKVNLQKCAISPIRCDGLNLDVLAASLPCQSAQFPCTYLGLPSAVG